jgi:hypothetical protein
LDGVYAGDPALRWGLYLGTQRHDWLAAALFMTTIGAVVTALIADSKPREKRDERSRI